MAAAASSAGWWEAASAWSTELVHGSAASSRAASSPAGSWRAAEGSLRVPGSCPGSSRRPARRSPSLPERAATPNPTAARPWSSRMGSDSCPGARCRRARSSHSGPGSPTARLPRSSDPQNRRSRRRRPELRAARRSSGRRRRRRGTGSGSRGQRRVGRAGMASRRCGRSLIEHGSSASGALARPVHRISPPSCGRLAPGRSSDSIRRRARPRRGARSVPAARARERSRTG